MPRLKKVLILSYYWPPSGGAGVQRWLKFVKYLRDFGWEPVVYTPENPERPVVDESLERDVPEGVEVIKTSIWEPYRLYKRFVGRHEEDRINSAFLSEGRKAGLAERISVWLRGNLFIPDARRYWIKPSTRYLDRYLRDHPVDAIVSTGPPHSMHMIACGLRNKHRIPWLADFRDPWTHIDYYQDLMLSGTADRKHRRLEQLVLRSADAVVTVGKTMCAEFRNLAAGVPATRFHVITNGYDADDFPDPPSKRDRRFTLSHIGSLVKTRNHESLWKVLSGMCRKDDRFSDDLRVRLVGKVDYSATESIRQYGLQDHVERVAYLPHGEVMEVMQRSQILLLLLNDTPNARGILTGKLFEYLAAQRPVLCVGAPDGDTAEILEQTGAGVTAGVGDEAGLERAISGFYERYRNDTLQVNGTGVGNYSRKALTKKLATLLNEMVLTPDMKNKTKEGI